MRQFPRALTLLKVRIVLAGLVAVPALSERAAAEVDRVIERAWDGALSGAVTTVRLEGRRFGSPEFNLWAVILAGITARLVPRIATCGSLRFGQRSFGVRIVRTAAVLVASWEFE